MEKIPSIGEFEWYRNKILARETKEKELVCICMTGCRAYGAEEVRAALEKEIDQQGLSGKVELRSTGCHGFCARAPVLTIEPKGIQYGEVSPDDAFDIVSLTLKNHKLIDRLAYKALPTGEPIYHYHQIPFYKKQVKRVLADCGRIDPPKIEHYIAAGGHQSLIKVLSGMKPTQVIEEIKAAKLRGRGGAGFYTGVKWELAQRVKSFPKYIV